MSCDRADSVVHGYFDHELDAVSTAEFERHLAECADCRNAIEALSSLRSSINSASLYEKTPDALRQRVLADLNARNATSSVVQGRMSWRWLAVAAAVVLCAIAGWQLVSARRPGNLESVLVAEAVDAHLRSLEPGHLTDVLSTDQHTVKPWFDGKLDFAPPVKDFAGQGFPLQGGRLDVVHGRTIAALVYGRRKHLVNVFIWPANREDRGPRFGSEQGYQWMEWTKGGMEFCAVSDISSADLSQLQRLYAE